MTVLLILVLISAAIWYFTRSGSSTTRGAGGHAQNPQPTIGQYFDAMTTARRKANRVVVAHNMQQLLAIMQVYLQSHDGQYPDSLDALIAFEPSAQPLLVDPRERGGTAFIYVKPRGRRAVNPREAMFPSSIKPLMASPIRKGSWVLPTVRCTCPSG